MFSFTAAAEDLPAGRTALGGAGLVHVGSALFTPRSLSLSAQGGWFSESDFSVAGGVDEDYNLALGGAIAPTDWLEISVATRSAAHQVSYLSQSSVGRSSFFANDARANAKFGTRLIDGSLGLALELGARVPPPASGTSSFGEQVSPHATALVSYAFKPVPVLLHLNVGYLWDRSGTQSTLADPGRRFAFDTSAFSRLQTGLGAEARLRLSSFVIVPFAEYTLDVPFAAPNAFAAAPMRITPGVRLFAMGGFFAQASADIGITRVAADGVLPVPALAGGIALGYQASFEGGRVVEHEVIREVVKEAPAAPTTGVIHGIARDAANKNPLADVAIALPGYSRVLTDANGAFTLASVAPGEMELRAERTGYAEVRQKAQVAAGKEATVEFALAALPPPPPAPAYLKGTVVSEADKEVPATISIPSANIHDQAVPNGGEFKLELPAGEHTIEASAKDCLAQGKHIVIAPGETVLADFVLKKAPKKALVVLTKEKIEIKKQVHFATDKAVILPDSSQLLDEVAAVILANEGLQKIRIEGHTDDQGDDAHNLNLSERRASSVMSALIERGVDPARLVSVGFGETRPIAPNKTAKGRAANRRVEFMIAVQN